MEELKVIKETEILEKKISIYRSIEFPLFKADDVANWIEHSNVSVMLKQIDNDEKVKLNFATVNNVYTREKHLKTEAWFITEDGLYEICMQSRKAIAKTMKKKIKSYLKKMRLTGGAVEPGREKEFVNYNFSSFSEVTKMSMVNDLINANIEYQKKIEELKPDAEMANDIIKKHGLLTLKQVADTIEIGRTTLCSLLRQKMILSKQSGYNEPMGKYIKSKYFKTVVEEDELTKHVSIVTLVTPKGLKFIYRLIKRNELLDDFDTNLLTTEVQPNA